MINIFNLTKQLSLVHTSTLSEERSFFLSISNLLTVDIPILIIKMFIGILQKMKEGAENVEKKIQAKVESLKNVNEGTKGKY